MENHDDRIKRELTPPRLSAETKTLNQALILGQIFALDVVKKLATQSDHLQQTATRRNVVLVGAEVGGQVNDALGEKGNLIAAATGVLIMQLEFLQIDFFAHVCILLNVFSSWQRLIDT